MTSDLGWFSKVRRRGKIRSIEIYKSLYSQIQDRLNNNVPVVDILNWMDNKVTEHFYNRFQKVPTQGAMSNCKGRWNELIATEFFSQISLDFFSKTNQFVIIFRLPSSQSSNSKQDAATVSRFLNLFQISEFDREQALYNISEFKDKIFFSSPDYAVSIIEDRQLFENIEPCLRVKTRKPADLDVDIYEIYGLLKGQLKASEIKAVASIKVSNRPDRRYQALYETAMIKAIGYTSNQNWKYYMITAEESSQSDQRIFTQGIAPHGIAVNQYLQNVDHVYSGYTKKDLVNLVEDAILN